MERNVTSVLKLTEATGKQKDRLPLQRYGGGSQVSEPSSFSPCLKVHGFFLVLALYMNDLLYPGNGMEISPQYLVPVAIEYPSLLQSEHHQ